MPVMDPDLWWHISIGKSILHSGIPYYEKWNSFALGKPWFAYSWSNEIIYALFDRLWGVNGLIALKIILVAFLALSIAIVLSKLAFDWFFGLVLSTITMAALSSFMLLRPQTIIWAYAAIVLCIADKASVRGIFKKDLLILAFIGCLWANTHITTILGLIIIATWSYDFNVSIKENVSVVGVLLGAFFTGTLITPYFGREWIITLFKSNHPFAHGSIAEFGAANIRDYGTGMYVVLLTLFLIFTHFITKHKSIKALNLSRLLGLVCFSVAGLGIIKFLPFALVYLGCLIATTWRDNRGQLGELEIGIDKLRYLAKRIEGNGKIPGTSLALVALISVGVSTLYTEGIYKEKVPVDCLDYVTKVDLSSGPILNTFGDGGYIMHRLDDENGVLKQHVSMDGRTNVNPSEIAKAHGDALGGRINWHDYLDIVNPETVIWRNISPLTSLLFQSPDWCRVYCDGNAKSGFFGFY